MNTIVKGCNHRYYPLPEIEKVNSTPQEGVVEATSAKRIVEVSFTKG